MFDGLQKKYSNQVQPMHCKFEKWVYHHLSFLSRAVRLPRDATKLKLPLPSPFA